MEQYNNNHVQQTVLYQKLLTIIPNLPEHLQMGIPSLETKMEGDRTLYYSLSDKESDDVYYINLEQYNEDEDQTVLVTHMEMRISLSEEKAIPVTYSNTYKDMRLELDTEGNEIPQREHGEEVYSIFKSWLKNLDQRGYCLEAPLLEISVDEIKRRKIKKGIER